MKSFSIVVLVSGLGNNLQRMIDATHCTNPSPTLAAHIQMVIADRDGTYAIKRAQLAGIKTCVIKNGTALLAQLKSLNPDLIVLAGYLAILPTEIIQAFPYKIINIHPSLLPHYGGKGFYGLKVHQAVLKDKRKTSGATIHYVDSGVDTGMIISQQEIDIADDETPQSLQQKVLKIEHNLLIKTIDIICTTTQIKETICGH